jgi:hypothetical protein
VTKGRDAREQRVVILEQERAAVRDAPGRHDGRESKQQLAEVVPPRDGINSALLLSQRPRRAVQHPRGADAHIRH